MYARRGLSFCYPGCDAERGGRAGLAARMLEQTGGLHLPRLPRPLRRPSLGFLRRLLRGRLAPRSGRLLSLHRTAQRVHEVDHVRRRRGFGLLRRRQAGLVALQHLDNGVVVAVLEFAGVEMPGRVRAFDPQRLKLFILDRHELVAADLVTAALLPWLDDIARHRVDELLLEPVAGALVDLPERYPLARR